MNHFRESQAIASKVHQIVSGHAWSVSSSSRVIKLLGLDPSRVFETHARFGNTVAASLPLALAVAVAEGRLVRGMRVLLLMGSAGVSTAAGSFPY